MSRMSAAHTAAESIHMPSVDPGLKQLDLNLLGVLDALLREQSVTRAAESLGTTQSAVSHSLGRLRTFFDDSLFVKSSQGMVATRKAELLRQPVMDIMAKGRKIGCLVHLTSSSAEPFFAASWRPPSVQTTP